MREDESNWFSKWEEELPPQEELMPLTQTLISPHLAIAFDITQNQQTLLSDEEPARTLKRPRLVWTPQLHKRFVDAVAQLGIKNAVPKTIMQLMSVDGLTRENVASHLQKYRLYLKRMQGLSAGARPVSALSADPATDRLFASSPVPPHFLHPAVAARTGSDTYLPFVSVPALQQLQQHRHQHMAVAAAAGHRHFGSPGNRHFEVPILSRTGTPVSGYAVEDVEESGGKKKVLTLFPAGDD